MYQFCPENEDLATELLSKLRCNNERSVWSSPFALSVAESQGNESHLSSVIESQPPGAPFDVDTPERSSQVLQVKRQVSHDEDSFHVPSPKKLKLDVEETHQSEVIEESLNPASLPSQVLVRTEVMEESSNPASLPSQVLVKTEVMEESSNPASLPLHFLEKCSRIKESWCSEEAVTSEDLTIFLCPPHQIARVCCELGLSQLPDALLSVACQSFMSMATSISYSNSVAVIKHTVLPQVEKLSGAGSRLLLMTLTELLETFPHQMIEVVIVPCVTSNLTGHQADLLLKWMKTAAFNDSLKCQVIRQCSKKCYVLNEATVCVYQALFNTKECLEQIDLHSVVQLLSHNGLEHSKNLKFGKLLMSVITNHGKQVKRDDLDTLQHTVEVHKSFLHKSLKTALRKLSVV